jgi:hypothetical protein
LRSTALAYALDLHALYEEVHPKIRGKYALVWRLGPVPPPKDVPDQPPHSLLAMADVLFDAPPALANLKRRKLRVQICSYHLPPMPATLFVEDGPLPRGVTSIGELATPPPPPEYRCYGYWRTFAIYANQQWRHEHDQVAIAAETARVLEKQRAKDDAARRKRRAGGLDGLARRTLVRDWDGLVRKPARLAVRKLLGDAIRTLAATRGVAAKKQVLEQLVEAINRYNDDHGSFIDTPEREALMTCLEDVAAAAGLGEMTAALDEWRDW